MLENMLENFYKMLGLSTINVAMVDNEIAINDFAYFYFAIFNNRRLMHSVGRDEHGAVHEWAEWGSRILEVKHSYRSYTTGSELMFFHCECGNAYSNSIS